MPSRPLEVKRQAVKNNESNLIYQEEKEASYRELYLKQKKEKYMKPEMRTKAKPKIYKEIAKESIERYDVIIKKHKEMIKKNNEQKR